MKKVALITGSASGLGKRIAIELAKNNYRIVINYRTSDSKAKELTEQISKDLHTEATCIKADVSNYFDVELLINKTIDTYERLDVLVNAAGPYIFEQKRMVDYTVQEWEYMVSGNLNSAFYLAKHAIPIMRKNKWGRIINFGFSNAETAPAWLYRSAYAAAKVGLVSLTKTLALEEAMNGITANMICPGDIISPWKELSISDSLNSSNDGTPIGRIGTGEDISRVVTFLCEDKSDYLTGCIIPVTGGNPSIK